MISKADWNKLSDDEKRDRLINASYANRGLPGEAISDRYKRICAKFGIPKPAPDGTFPKGYIYPK